MKKSRRKSGSKASQAEGEAGTESPLFLKGPVAVNSDSGAGRGDFSGCHIPRGPLVMPKHIWLSSLGNEVLLALSGWRTGTLLNILQSTGQSHPREWSGLRCQQHCWGTLGQTMRGNEGCTRKLVYMLGATGKGNYEVRFVYKQPLWAARHIPGSWWRRWLEDIGIRLQSLSGNGRTWWWAGRHEVGEKSGYQVNWETSMRLGSRASFLVCAQGWVCPLPDPW